MTPIAPLITGFLREHMPVDKGCSPHTCETYAHAFRLLFIFASQRLATSPSQLRLEQIDAPMVLHFLAHIEEKRGNGAATRNSRLVAIKAFMQYVEFRIPSALEQARQIRAIPAKMSRPAACQASHNRGDPGNPWGARPDHVVRRPRPRNDPSLLLMRTPGLRIGPFAADERFPARRNQHQGAGQRKEGAVPSAMEGNYCRPTGLAGHPGRCPRSGTLRQCGRRCNDTRRVRVRSSETCRYGSAKLYFASRPDRDTSPASSQLRAGYASGHP